MTHNVMLVTVAFTRTQMRIELKITSVPLLVTQIP